MRFIIISINVFSLISFKILFVEARELIDQIFFHNMQTNRSIID